MAQGANISGQSQPVYITDATGAATAGTQVSGTSASGVADDGSNPVKVGARVVSGTIGAQTAGFRTDLTTDLLGNLRTLLAGLPVTVADPGSAQYTTVALSNKPATAGGPLLILNSVWDGALSYIQRGDAEGTFIKDALAKVADLAGVRITFNSTAEQTIIAAVAAQSTRIHRFRISVGGAATIAIRAGVAGTILEVLQFPAAGAFVLDFSSRWYWATGLNAAFTLQASAAVQVEGRVEYITSA